MVWTHVGEIDSFSSVRFMWLPHFYPFSTIFVTFLPVFYHFLVIFKYTPPNTKGNNYKINNVLVK